MHDESIISTTQRRKTLRNRARNVYSRIETKSKPRKLQTIRKGNIAHDPRVLNFNGFGHETHLRVTLPHGVCGCSEPVSRTAQFRQDSEVHDGKAQEGRKIKEMKHGQEGGLLKRRRDDNDYGPALSFRLSVHTPCRKRNSSPQRNAMLSERKPPFREDFDHVSTCEIANYIIRFFC